MAQGRAKPPRKWVTVYPEFDSLWGRYIHRLEKNAELHSKSHPSMKDMMLARPGKPNPEYVWCVVCGCFINLLTVSVNLKAERDAWAFLRELRQVDEFRKELDELAEGIWY